MSMKNAAKRPARDAVPAITDEQWKGAKRGQRAGRVFRVPLSMVRRERGKTQVAVAEEAEMVQGIVSRLEAREDLDDVRVATLRRYIEALGGELELVAKFPDRQFVLTGGPVRR